MKLPFKTIVSVIVVAIVAVVLGTIVVTRDNSDAEPAVEPAVTKEVAVERGNISVSQTVDGTVEETDTIIVVHRIEGQTPSAAASQAAATPAATPNSGASAAPVGFASPDSTETSTLAVTTDPDSAIVAVAFLTAAVPPAGTTPTGTTPTDTTPGPGVSAPATTPIDTAPTDTAPADTAPTDTTPTDTTPTDTTPTDTTPTDTTPADTTPSRPGGAAPSGGAPLAAPAGGTSGGATGASNETVTEMITGIAAASTPISSGDVLYTVESRPVIALDGALPAWRTMSSSSDDGTDIEQLEAALVALGYDPDGDVTVDTSWTSDTTAMVKRWQVGTGTDDTGEVTLGSVVFIPHAASVASTSVEVGDEVGDGAKILELSGTVQQVIIEVPAELQADVTPSMRVDIAGTGGTVTRLRSADGADGVTVQAVINPDAPLDVEVGSTVKVTISYDLATDQLVVPTDAVVSRLDGTYAIQTLDDSGAHMFAAVEVVAVSGNRTAVTGGGLTESTVVFVPA